MSVWDYLLPWKAIPNMIEDVKKASSTEGKGKYDSVFGAIGKYADPFGALLGSDVQNFVHGTIPREMNRAIQPWNDFHMKYLDPLAMSGVTPTEMRKVGSFKGADATAAALGATALGMMTGGFGLGGGSGSGGSSGGFFQNPYANMDWSNPQTYMQLAQSMPQQPQTGLGGYQRVGYQPMTPIDPSASDQPVMMMNYGLGRYGGGPLRV